MPNNPFQLAYITLSTCLCGGNKIIFQHVQLLNKTGIKAVVISKEDYPEWIDYQVPFLKVNSWEQAINKADFFIATFYSLVLELWNFHKIRNRLIHFSQGFEIEYEEAKSFSSSILEAYDLPCPLWTISENLTKKIKKNFPQKKIYTIGQPLDIKNFYPVKAKPPEPPIRLILLGPLNISIKGIQFGLKCLKILKQECPFVEIIRISQVDTQEQEKDIICAEKYFTSLPPNQVGTLFRNSHILFSPSLEGEGFGLPPLEAMACGTATCLSAISSYLSWDSTKDYALFFEPLNIYDAVDKLKTLVNNRKIRDSISKRGLEVSKKFHPDSIAKQIYNFLQRFPA